MVSLAQLKRKNRKLKERARLMRFLNSKKRRKTPFKLQIIRGKSRRTKAGLPRQRQRPVNIQMSREELRAIVSTERAVNREFIPHAREELAQLDKSTASAFEGIKNIDVI